MDDYRPSQKLRGNPIEGEFATIDIVVKERVATTGFAVMIDELQSRICGLSWIDRSIGGPEILRKGTDPTSGSIGVSFDTCNLITVIVTGIWVAVCDKLDYIMQLMADQIIGILCYEVVAEVALTALAVDTQGTSLAEQKPESSSKECVRYHLG